MNVEPVLYGFTAVTPARLLFVSLFSALCGFLLSTYQRKLQHI